MKFGQVLREALTAIGANRSRTALTLLGIVIGVGAVITVVGVGDGARTVIGDLLGSYGSSSLLVIPNESAVRRSQWRYQFEEITREDIRQINAEADAVKAVTPQIELDVAVASHTNEVEARLLGTLHHLLTAADLEMKEGRFLVEEDDLYMRKICVLGYDLARKLYGDGNPLGQFLTIEGDIQVEVVGVLRQEEKSFISTVSDLDRSNNNTVFVPAATVGRVGGSSFIYVLIGDAVSEDRIDEAKRQIVSILTANHGRWDGKYDKFVVQEMAAILDTIDTVTGTITAFISVIAGIALVVAGIGIMNIMLVSVKERTREIGTRKALGARSSAILNQFVLETLIVCGGGGLLGVGLAAILVFVVASVWNWPALISPQVVQLSVYLSLGTGLVFGLYPAGKAARMDPVEALRYE